jgi:hypothetical protein
MDPLGGGELVRGHRPRLRANEEQRVSESRIQKPVECRHGLSS